MNGFNKIWFTSDLHFGHKNIWKFTDRKLDTTEENHDKWLVEIWNHHVGRSDVVYHLGDFSFANTTRTQEFARRLNGHKYLIKGNHDSVSTLNNLRDNDLIISWYDYIEIKIDGQTVVLFHFPIMSWHKQSHGSWHLHGHCHGNLKDSRGKMLDVGLDASRQWCIDRQKYSHRFFEWTDIKSIMEDKKQYTADFHRENV